MAIFVDDFFGFVKFFTKFEMYSKYYFAKIIFVAYGNEIFTT